MQTFLAASAGPDGIPLWQVVVLLLAAGFLLFIGLVVWAVLRLTRR